MRNKGTAGERDKRAREGGQGRTGEDRAAQLWCPGMCVRVFTRVRVCVASIVHFFLLCDFLRVWNDAHDPFSKHNFDKKKMSFSLIACHTRVHCPGSLNAVYRIVYDSVRVYNLAIDKMF